MKNGYSKAIAFIVVLLLVFPAFLPGFAAYGADAQSNEGLRDISGHWGESYIKNALSAGFITGYEDGTFKPEANVTRAEFITMINKVFGFITTTGITFSDVSIDDWFFDEIAAARAAGYINGYPDETMKPNSPVMREEAASILMKISKLTADPEAANILADAYLLTWSKGAVGAILKTKIMEGYPDGNFGPQLYLKRAEAVTLIDKAIKHLATAVTPNAPDVTRNDSTNTVSGMTTEMEYKLDSNGWVPYSPEIFKEINFSGNHVLLVRFMASGVNPYGPSTKLVFTTNHTSHSSYPRQLTIADPELQLTKVYDGTTSAAVTIGALSRVLSGDDVSVNAVAAYTTMEPGFNKTITVVYTISGADAGKYIKPRDFTTNFGTITEVNQYAVTFVETNNLADYTIELFGDFNYSPTIGVVFYEYDTGQKTTALANGTYWYRATKSDFEDVMGLFTVSGAAVTENLTMVSAMSVIFSEDFTGVNIYELPVGWTANTLDWFVDYYNDCQGEVPELSYVTYYETGTFVVSSPAINVTSATSTINLSFKHYLSFDFQPTATPIIIKVQVSTDGAIWTDTSFVDDPTYQEYPNSMCGPYTANVDLSNYKGETIYLAWVISGNTDYIQYWSIDDIVVSGY